MKILVPVDGSPHSLAAVRHALNLVKEGLRASLVLANVQEPTYLYEMVLAPDAEVLERVSGAVSQRALSSAEAVVRDSGVAVEIETEAALGDVPHTLLDVAENHGCELIVMGSRGLGSFRRGLIGSVSQTVMHDAKIPVTVVRHVEEA